MTRKMRLELGLLKVGEVAKEGNVLPSTIRYYTDIGLLKVKTVTDGGYRLYEKQDTLVRLGMVRKANEGHKELSEIRQLLN